MLTIVIQVDAPPGQAIGVKEHLAMCLERYGDTRVVEIRETGAEQMRMEGEKQHELPWMQMAGRDVAAGGRILQHSAAVQGLSHHALHNRLRAACAEGAQARVPAVRTVRVGRF